MKYTLNTFFRAAIMPAACCLLPLSAAETIEAPKKEQVSDEQHQANLAATLPKIKDSKSIGLLNWHRDRARDKNEGWVRMELSPEQLAEVKPILARMKVNPKASLKPNPATSCGHNFPMTNWRFVDADGKEFFVSMTYDMTADPSTGADWLLSQEDMDALESIVKKYVAAAL